MYTQGARARSGPLTGPRSPNFQNCGHRSAAGFRYANPGTPVQLRLTAPFSFTRRASACAAESPKLRQPGASPGRRAKSRRGLSGKRQHGRFAPGRSRSVTGRFHQFQSYGGQHASSSRVTAAATFSRGMPRPADCKPAVSKQAGSDKWRTTTIPHHIH